MTLLFVILMLEGRRNRAVGDVVRRRALAVRSMLRRYAPELEQDTEALAKEYAGRERLLLAKLKARAQKQHERSSEDSE